MHSLANWIRQPPVDESTGLSLRCDAAQILCIRGLAQRSWCAYNFLACLAIAANPMLLMQLAARRAN